QGREQYWDEALETMPWQDVLSWQGQQLGAFIAGLRSRSPLYARLYAKVPGDTPIRCLEDVQALPFTFKEDVRSAQDEADDERPIGASQAVSTRDIVQVLSSSGTTGAPLYYALTAADVERVADAVANTFFTAGVLPDD